MSAIWGVIDKNNAISDELVTKMQNSMQEFKIDRYDREVRGKIYFACGHQYFTEEARGDSSPYYDISTDTLFTADCVLYNRNALIQALVSDNTDITYGELEKQGDAMLSYWAYRHWGERFVEQLRGAFSIAVYEASKDLLLLYTDHLAQRYLSYYCDEHAICFSTLYQPLLAYLGEQRKELCDEWIVAAYSDCSADTLKLPGRTVYKNVYQVEPGHYIKINHSSSHIENITYWNPLHLKKKWSKMDDARYQELFFATFDNVVRSMLRAKGKTGIMLSGGLDSSSVAALAATNLAKEGKNLYSYTAVPASGFKYQNGKYYIENETELIYAQQRMHHNIISRFVNVEDLNCFTKLRNYVHVFCEPVKPALNMINVEGIAEAAAKDGCSILLSGQNGNATISYGSILSYVYQKCSTGHFVAAYKEANAFCSLRHVSRKKLLHVFFHTLKEERWLQLHFGEDCLLKDSDIEKYHLYKLEKKIRKERGNGFLDSKKQRRGFCFMPLVFQHMGFYDTYSSLKYGVLSLDPTLTKDMIELCMSLPIDCYVHGGKERRVVRDYMKGYVPEEILENHTGRGVQAADYAYRVNRDWDKIREEVFDILQEPLLREYLDENKLQALIDETKEKEHNLDKNVVARLAVISSLGYFLRMIRGK